MLAILFDSLSLSVCARACMCVCVCYILLDTDHSQIYIRWVNCFLLKIILLCSIVWCFWQLSSNHCIDYKRTLSCNTILSGHSEENAKCQSLKCRTLKGDCQPSSIGLFLCFRKKLLFFQPLFPLQDLFFPFIHVCIKITQLKYSVKKKKNLIAGHDFWDSLELLRGRGSEPKNPKL